MARPSFWGVATAKPPLDEIEVRKGSSGVLRLGARRALAAQDKESVDKESVEQERESRSNRLSKYSSFLP